MLPLRSRAVLASSRWIAARANHTGTRSPDTTTKTTPSRAARTALTGAAKLLAEAVEEEAHLPSKDRSRDHLVASQGPVWSGDESQQDAVLRMLVDVHKPHRTGEGVKPDSADKRISQWMVNLDMSPREQVVKPRYEVDGTVPIPLRSDSQGINPHRTNIPPHLHRPWHATYTGDNQEVVDTPRVKWGTFESTQEVQNLFSDLELRLSPNADGTTRQKNRQARRTARLQGRLGGAREGALDYHLGVKDGDLTDGGKDDDDDVGSTFRGNRQLRGLSVLGAQRGGASGMRAWTGLVEDRIQRAMDNGHFRHVQGRGKPLVNDPEMRNPTLEPAEVFMNRIIKRQGALPPWIEMQNLVDTNLSSFRTMLFDSYTRHLVRSVLSAHGLHPLPPRHAIPDRDEAWEAREEKFHDASVKSINDLIFKMNAQAPAPARRPKITREVELKRIRGDPLRQAVWAGIEQRAQDIKDLEARGPPQRHSFLTSGQNVTSRFGDHVSKSLGSFGASQGDGRGHSGGDNVSGGSMSHDSHHAGGGKGLLVFACVGLGTIVYFRRHELRTESLDPDLIPLIPLHDDEEEPPSNEPFLVSSPKEPHYSVLQVLNAYILEPFLTLVRFLHLAILFGPVIITAPMLFVGSTPRRRPGKPVAEQEEGWGAVWWYGFLVAQMERAGPSFIKLAQWAASRTDLFPAPLCQKMSKLHSNNDPHPFKYTKKVIEKSFGVSFDDIFEEFDETPIGCGAIAQVYRAKLRPSVWAHSDAEAQTLALEIAEKTNGDQRLVTTVAVKVLHPRVEKLVSRDIAIMSIFANIVNAFPGMEWISLPEEVLVFGEMMNQQLDLRVEAANLYRFERNFSHRGKIVTFPRPIKVGDDSQTFASREVLIEEFEDALPLKYFLRNGGGPYDEKIANYGLDAFLEMLLLDNWTHGDLHPGNIMVRFIKPGTTHIIRPLLNRLHRNLPPQESPIPMESISAVELVHELKDIAHDKDKWLERLDELSDEGYAPQLVFIDAGLVTSLNEKNRRDFLDLFQAVAEFDGYRAGKLMVERCRRPDLAIDEETFALKIQHLVLSVKSKTFSLAKIKISDILTDVLVAVRQHHVKLEGDFVNTVLSILLLEGIGRQLDPDMDLFKSALPILRQLGRQMGPREAMAGVQTGSIWAMAKLWVWAEARGVMGEASAIDKWVKYDWLSPNI